MLVYQRVVSISDWWDHTYPHLSSQTSVVIDSPPSRQGIRGSDWLCRLSFNRLGAVKFIKSYIICLLNMAMENGWKMMKVAHAIWCNDLANYNNSLTWNKVFYASCLEFRPEFCQHLPCLFEGVFAGGLLHLLPFLQDLLTIIVASRERNCGSHSSQH